MEVVRYVIVFLTVGWIGALISTALTFISSPLLSPLRGTDIGRGVVAVISGAGVLASIYLAHLFCNWTGSPSTYAMYLAPAVAMLINDRQRIRDARRGVSNVEKQGGDPGLRNKIVLTEKMSLVADVIGFITGLIMVPIEQFV